MSATRNHDKRKTHSPTLLSRRQFVRNAAIGTAVAGAVAGGLPLRARAAGELVALVNTQAAGDNGPVLSLPRPTA